MSDLTLKIEELENQISLINTALKQDVSNWSDEVRGFLGNKDDARRLRNDLQKSLRDEKRLLLQEKQKETLFNQLLSDGAKRKEYLLNFAKVTAMSLLPETKVQLTNVLSNFLKANVKSDLENDLEMNLLQNAMKGDQNSFFDALQVYQQQLSSFGNPNCAILSNGRLLKFSIILCRYLAQVNDLDRDLYAVWCLRRTFSLFRWFIFNARLLVEFPKCSISQIPLSGFPISDHLNHMVNIKFDWKKLCLKDSNYAPPEFVNNPYLQSNIQCSFSDLPWQNAEFAYLKFFKSRFDLPEAKFVHLWDKLFEAFLNHEDSQSIKLFYELRMDEIPHYSDQRVDIAAALLYGQIILPVLLVEAAGPTLASSEIDAKDYQKLAVEMQAWLLYQIGIFRKMPNVLKELRIFGAFVCGTQIQYCLMYPLIDNFEKSSPLEISFIFETLSHWRYDLSDNNKGCFDDHCRYCLDVSKLDNGNENFCSIELGSANEINQDLLGEACQELKNLPSIREIEDDLDQRTAETLIETNDNDQTQSSTPNRCLLSLKAFMHQVKSYTHWLKGFTKDSPELDDPFDYPRDLPSAPSSRKSHNSDTPKANRTLQSTPKNLRTLRSAQIGNKFQSEKVTKTTFVETFESMVSGETRLLASVTKFRNMDEIVLLEKLQGMPNIVELMDSQANSKEGWYCMTLDYLEEVICPDPSSELEFLSFAVQYLRDGFSALNSLRSHGIVHRDICCRNIRYSPYHGQFMLYDFDLALETDPSGSTMLQSNGTVGTEGYIAPEITAKQEYSFPVDVFSFGKCIEKEIMTPMVFVPEDPRTGIDILLNSIFLLMIGCTNDKPCERPSASELVIKHSELLAESLVKVKNNILKLNGK